MVALAVAWPGVVAAGSSSSNLRDATGGIGIIDLRVDVALGNLRAMLSRGQ